MSKKKSSVKSSTKLIHLVKVALGQSSYNIHIGSGLLDKAPALMKLKSKKVMVISDKDLPEHRARLLKALDRDGFKYFEIAVKAGEELKNFETIYPIYGEMLKAGIDRNSTLIALGGGTVGDAAGFIASTFLRGIPWVGIPTTLLSQVDSAVGGKTGVNHPQGKNLIGTFHQPSMVICDTDLLRTLSTREVISGLGETLKYGLTFDRKFFEFIESNWLEAIDLEPKIINRIVKTSIEWKAKAVAKDEFDLKGVREVLNFGHTFAHALEFVTDYKTFQHGEAVIWGMRFAIALSKVCRKLSSRSFEKADLFLREIPLPPLPQVDPEEFFTAMTRDKKAKDGKVRFVLLKEIGKTQLERQITKKQLLSAFELLNKKDYSHGRK